jgi:hypothetical protein
MLFSHNLYQSKRIKLVGQVQFVGDEITRMLSDILLRKRNVRNLAGERLDFENNTNIVGKN